jgi:aryl-alcohol dehydrogenase-like predicted oxidoreductase
MLYRRLGRTNLQVSELAFGAARGADTDREEFYANVRSIFDAGINFVDTAAGYGTSEEALGEILQDYGDIIVETKYCPYESYAPEAKYTGSPKELIESAETSLRRLKLDQLDILLGHGIRTPETLDRFMTDGCYDALVKLRDQGKVRFIGISELSEKDGTHEILKLAVPTGAFDVVMLTLNFLLQTAAKSVLPLCEKHDVGTVVMMPLNQPSRESGLVSVDAAKECVRRHIKKGNLPDESPYGDSDLFDFLQPYPIPAAALRYVLAHEVSCCCVGMSNPERLAENLRVVDPPYLDEERLSKLRDLFGGIEQQVL